jgi:hypothetical protein
MNRPWIRLYFVHPGDARGWIALGCYSLVLVVLAMIVFKSSLLESDAFLILATAVVITGWVNGPVGWAYQATKGGGEAAESSARIAEMAAGVPPAAPESATAAADETAAAAVDKAAEIKGKSDG